MYFLEWNFFYFDQMSLKFVFTGKINNKPALVQVMTFRRPGSKPLSWPIGLHGPACPIPEENRYTHPLTVKVTE